MNAAEPSPQHNLDLKQEEVLTKRFWAVKAQRNSSWYINTFVFEAPSWQEQHVMKDC